ncbi:hypothetical protein Q5P01_005803 [Channa striata]|uniref:Uncharacterized protein n=1 Tax=Channa striata TaxID=64152 RepID=A0AA88ND90_CHASR|nr:hypothetical protein Q5P01_005803 [Channa striata]
MGSELWAGAEVHPHQLNIKQPGAKDSSPGGPLQHCCGIGGLMTDPLPDCSPFTSHVSLQGLSLRTVRPSISLHGHASSCSRPARPPGCSGLIFYSAMSSHSGQLGNAAVHHSSRAPC